MSTHYALLGVTQQHTGCGLLLTRQVSFDIIVMSGLVCCPLESASYSVLLASCTNVE